MKLGLVGTGRVAFHLSQALIQQGHQIIQVCGRNFEKTQQFADSIQAVAHQEIQSFQPCDCFVIAVSDISIADVAKQLSQLFPESLILHTSGSTDLQVIQQYQRRAGVFYPLQTFSFERAVNWAETPLFVEANDPEDLAQLTNLANSLSNRVYQYSSKQRLTLHLAAVFACNFSHYCYDMAKQIVDAEQVDFSLLYLLISETANKVMTSEPKQSQTGPAMRGDQNILNRHKSLLLEANRPDLAEIYHLMSDGIFKRHHPD